MSEINHSRAGLIDGLPSSYNTSYVIKTGKVCELCLKFIKQKQIDKNEIICTEEFDFYHKSCLEKKKITYEYQKPDDKSSVIKLISPQIV